MAKQPKLPKASLEKQLESRHPDFHLQRLGRGGGGVGRVKAQPALRSLY